MREPDTGTLPAGEPPAETPALADFVTAVRDSGILNPEQLGGLEALLGEGRREPPDLAWALLARGWLTPFQLRRVYRGESASLAVGPYRLLDSLGQGGFAERFLARHTPTDRPVALKLIRAERLARGCGAERFLRRAESAARLDHPHLARAFDAGLEGDHYYVATEYVDGMDLRRLVERGGPLEPARACEYVRQAALGLQYALGQGLVHRDLKPSNLMLSRDGVVKVLDLGLTRLDVPESAGEAFTPSGEVFGSPDYLAPEQVQDAATADARADLYSLGCTLYFLLGGRVPFPGRTAVKKLLRHLKEEPEPLEALRPGVPPALAAVVRRLMAKDPARRYQSPAELADALARL
jgi:eukaryotic-like serine/threonine-protein kinase